MNDSSKSQPPLRLLPPPPPQPYDDASKNNLLEDVAVLYKNSDLSGCGHTISWIAVNLIDLQTCPVCAEHVQMICDVPSVVNHNNNNNNDHDNDNPDESDYHIIRFKFGKKIYQLSTTVTTKSNEKSEKDDSSWWPRRLRRRWHTSTTMATPSRSSPTTALAQDRIAEALNLVNLKILHKGTIIYPRQSQQLPFYIDPEGRNTADEATRISQQILKISHKDWTGSDRRKTKESNNNNNSNSNKKKLSLVVMGTPKERQLIQQQHTRNTTGTGTIGGTTILQQCRRYILVPVILSVQLTWLFFKSFFGPILPSYYFLPVGRRRRNDANEDGSNDDDDDDGGRNNDNDDNNRNRSTITNPHNQSRPHQE